MILLSNNRQTADITIVLEAHLDIEESLKMDNLIINGGNRLYGEITISGAKNAALPILCASLLTADDIELTNVPHLSDVQTMLALLQQMGVTVRQEGDKMILNGGAVHNFYAPYELVKTMRAAILVLCPLVARFGQAQVSLPGGCAIGSSLVDHVIKGLSDLGGEVEFRVVYFLA